MQAKNKDLVSLILPCCMTQRLLPEMYSVYLYQYTIKKKRGGVINNKPTSYILMRRNNRNTYD